MITIVLIYYNELKLLKHKVMPIKLLKNFCLKFVGLKIHTRLEFRVFAGLRSLQLMKYTNKTQIQ